MISKKIIISCMILALAVTGVMFGINTFAVEEEATATLVYSESTVSYDILVSSSSSGYLEVLVIE